MRVPEGIDYVWTVRLKNGTIVENFVERDGELIESPFWAIKPRDIVELLVSSADGSERLFRIDVRGKDMRPIWFRRNVMRITSGGGQTAPQRFIEGYYFGFRRVSTNEKAVIKVDMEGTILLLNDDQRGEIDKVQEKTLRWKRWKTWRKFKRCLSKD